MASRLELRSQLAANVGGVSYSALDPQCDSECEVRHLSDAALREDIGKRLRHRLRLIELLEHPSAARLLEFDLSATPPTVVLQHRPTRRLNEYWEQGTHNGQDVLQVLDDVAQALVEARELGLSHGAIRGDTVRIDDAGHPIIDFTGWDAVSEEEAPVFMAPYAVGAMEQADVRGLASVIELAMRLTAVGRYCKERSPRLAAQLKQLVSLARDEVTQVEVELHVFADCVQSLLKPSRRQGDTSEDSSTDDLALTNDLQRTNQLDALDENDSTQCISDFNPRAQGDEQTAEVSAHRGGNSSQPAWQRQLKTGDRLGRFRIESKLGEGGMGSVYKAIDIIDGKPVAIKTLNAMASTRRNALLRFQKEARLLAAVNNPHVTNLIEVNRDGELDYIVLEYVDGIDLKRIIQGTPKLSEPMAISIASDVARALVDAHQQGIVHRDIKPENILLAQGGMNSDLTDLVTIPTAKLTDFGIARHIDQSVSMELTQAGGSLGTPIYMSPEQCKGGRNLSPAADIYALGVTLFEMLAGEPPFRAEDAMSLAAKHCFETPPSVRDFNPHVSEPLERLIAKCLSKQTQDRYVDAAHILNELEKLSRGESSDIAMHPALPDDGKAVTISNTMEWQLRASAIDLWPLVSNTERLNRAIGLPAVNYSTEFEPNHGVRRFGNIRLAGMPIRWEEHPFEWIEGRRMSVLREFAHGPFKWFVSSVELEPQPQGGTLLRHHVEIAPRNLLGRFAARIETGAKCRKALDRVYTRFDQALHGQLGDARIQDPFESETKLRPFQQSRIADRVERLTEQTKNQELVQLLGDFLLTAPTQEVTQMRPLQLARRWDQKREELIELCMLACQVGLLKMQWDVICPTCRVAADTRDFLQEIKDHTNCEACNHDFDSDLAGAVELVFSAHPDIRETKIGRYCIGGPGSHPHVVSQIRLAEHESFELELNLSEGEYLLRGPNYPHSFVFQVRPVGLSTPFRVNLAVARDVSQTIVMRAGHQVIQLDNETDRSQLIRIERLASRNDAVTAAQAMAIPRFRQLFPQQLLPSGQLMKSENVVMLAARLVNQSQLFDELGDAQTYIHLQSAIQTLREEIAACRGEFVKSESGCVYAVFDRLSDAVESAFRLEATVSEIFTLSESSTPSETQLAIAVHMGPAVVATSNDVLDYCGAMPYRLAQLIHRIPQGVTLTEAVYADPEVYRFLQGANRQGANRQGANRQSELATINLDASYRLLTYRYSHA